MLQKIPWSSEEQLSFVNQFYSDPTMVTSISPDSLKS